MQEGNGFVAVADGCTELNGHNSLSHTVLGVFFTAEDAKLACSLRATALGNPIELWEDEWDEDPKGIWSAGTESGETLYGVSAVGEFYEEDGE